MEKKQATMKIKAEEPKKEKLSYEQLENVCHQLSEQSRNLYQRLQDVDMSNLFKRLDYLFAVIENRAAFPEDFIKSCTDEIIFSMTVPKEEETKEKTEK